MGRRSSTDGFTNNLPQLRAKAGWSQQELADRADLTRQAVQAIEAGKYVPNTVVAMNLARALSCSVEDVFSLATDEHHIVLDQSNIAMNARLIIGRVGGRTVSHALAGERAIAEGFLPSDGIADGPRAQVTVAEELIDRTAFIVGCDPSLGILASWVTRIAPDRRLIWIPGSSKGALDHLGRGAAHVAGVHMRDPRTGEFNIASAKRGLRSGGAVISYAAWEQGLMLAPGNPSGITGVEGLLGKGVRLVNREQGSGSRALLDQLLTAEGIASSKLAGYDNAASSHIGVARRVVDGSADAGIGLRAVASIFGLDFVPLAEARFDLLIPAEHMDHPAIATMLELLQARGLRRELAALPGYDITELGSVRKAFDAAA